MTCDREIESWPDVFCPPAPNRCNGGKGPFQYPKIDAYKSDITYHRRHYDNECDTCWLKRYNKPQHIGKDVKKASSVGIAKGKLAKADLKLKAVRRGPLTQDEKKKRKAQVEAVFNDPKKLELQQRLMGEAGSRMSSSR
jgi:hypothetical protein